MTKNIEIKVGLFVLLGTLLTAAALGFFAYKKDLFAKVHTFTLFARVGDDIVEGMPVIFSGFKIGRVHTLELNKDGLVIIKIKVPERHVNWLRQNSVFTVDKPLLGAARLIVTTPDPPGPPLTAKMMPEVKVVNNIAEIAAKINPVVERVSQIADHLEKTLAQIASPEGEVSKILRNSEQLTAKMAKKDSLLEMAVNDRAAIQAVHDSLRKTRELTAQVEAILKKLDAMAQKTDEGIYGKEGSLPLVNKILKETLLKLDKVSAALDNVTKITADVSDSTTNMKRLRQELDATVGSINDLVNEINRKVPFRKQPEIKLP